jgi:hypothetical protein
MDKNTIKSKLVKITRNIFWKIKSVRWNVQIFFEDAAAWCINKYNVQPQGYCPVQAEGYLPGGEFYYFRSRHTTWCVRIAKDEESLWDSDAWVYKEEKYNGFDGGCISKFEAVRNFNKAVKLYNKE